MHGTKQPPPPPPRSPWMALTQVFPPLTPLIQRLAILAPDANLLRLTKAGGRLPRRALDLPVLA